MATNPTESKDAQPGPSGVAAPPVAARTTGEGTSEERPIPPPLPAPVESSVYGPACNATFMRTWLAGSPMFGNAILRNIDCFPFLESWSNKIVPTACTVFGGLKMIHYNSSVRPDLSLSMTLAMGELLAPFLPQEVVLPKAEAREAFVKIMASSKDNGMVPIISNNASPNVAWSEDQFKGFLATPGFYEAITHPTVGYSAEEVSAVDKFMTSFTSVGLDPFKKAYTRFLIYLYGVTPTFKVSGVHIIAHTITSVCKRGSVSQQFIRKIQTGIAEDTGTNLLLDSTVLRVFYKTYGAYINETNAEALFTQWGGIIPINLSLRLGLTIIQCAGTGLTSYLTIKEALELYQDFPWIDLQKLIATDFKMYKKATEIIKSNIYYGFAVDLKDAKSTNYKNLAYVAKELLIRIEKKTSLSGYAGWTTMPLQRAKIDEMIIKYSETANNREPDDNAEGNEGYQQVLDEIRKNLGIATAAPAPAP